MMKRLRYSLLAILALFTLTVSCVDPLEPVPVNQSSIPDNALVFSPKVLGITPATKTTDGEVNRGENAVTRLDVFVYKYKTTGGSVEFLEHYTIGDGSTEIDTGVDHLLESNWRTKYTTTDTYRIYAIANINANKLNNPVLPSSPTEAQLLALTSESDATITGQYGYTCYDIVRLQNLEGTIPAVNGSLDHHISKKLFLMDGKIDNWKVDPNATRQYFTKYPSTDATYYPNFELSRAAGSLITRELRAACGFDGPKMRSKFDGYVTRLQMACRIVTEDFVYPTDKHGREYGWGWSLLTVPESLLGRDLCQCQRTPQESFERMKAHLRHLLPEATDKQIEKLIK